MDAEFVAERFYRTRSVIKFGHEGLPSVSLSEKLFVSVLRSLLFGDVQRSYFAVAAMPEATRVRPQEGISKLGEAWAAGVEIWTGSGEAWTRKRRATQGNLEQFEDILAPDAAGEAGGAPGQHSHMRDALALDAAVAAVHASEVTGSVSDVRVGLAWANTLFRTIGFVEFIDSGADFGLLEATLVRLNVRECVLPYGSPVSDEVRPRASRSGDVELCNENGNEGGPKNDHGVERCGVSKSSPRGVDCPRRSSLSALQTNSRRLRACLSAANVRVVNAQIAPDLEQKSDWVSDALRKLLFGIYSADVAADTDADTDVSDAGVASGTDTGIAAEQQLAHLLRSRDALRATAALLLYCNLTNSRGEVDLQRGAADAGHWRLAPCTMPNCMILDAATLRALQVFPRVPHHSVSTAPPVDGCPDSLFGLLNHCRSAMGARVLLRWLRQPLLDTTAIEARLDAVEALVSDPMLRGELRSCAGCEISTTKGNSIMCASRAGLRHLPDLERLSLRLRLWIRRSAQVREKSWSAASVGLRELVSIYSAVTRLPIIADMLQRAAETGGTAARSLAARFTPCLRAVSLKLKRFEALVEQAIDAHALFKAKVATAGSNILGDTAASGIFRARGVFGARGVRLRSSYHAELRRLNLELHEREVAALAIAKQVAEELGLQLLHEGARSKTDSDEHQSRLKAAHKRRGKANSWLKLEYNTTHGMHLRLPGKDQKLLSRKGKQAVPSGASASGSSSTFVVLSVQKAGVLFTTEALREADAVHMKLRRQYEAAQAELAAQALEVAAGYCALLDTAATALAELDVLASLAHVAALGGSGGGGVAYVRPTLRRAGQGDLELVALRHPLVEAHTQMRGTEAGGGYIASNVTMRRSDSRFQIITGPNMGGKSTYIRAVALVSLLAQVGSFVPCSSAAVPLVDAVFARVGAADDMARGVSTFLAEMLELGAIVRRCTPSSLVIIDELGRGTSTSDGFGLAWAVSEHLARDIRPLCLFATHFHELTRLAPSSVNDEDRHRSETPDNAVYGPPVPGVANLHVTALTDSHQQQLTFLYEVRSGVCDRSFGIYVAELARFPSTVVEEARLMAERLDRTGEKSCVSESDKHEAVRSEHKRARLK